jgi:hypothetical protein
MLMDLRVKILQRALKREGEYCGSVFLNWESESMK